MSLVSLLQALGSTLAFVSGLGGNREQL